MSIVAAYLTPNRVWITTDTGCYSMTGKGAYLSPKAFHLPHLRMVVGGVGLSLASFKFFEALQLDVLPNGIDDLPDVGPRAARDAFEAAVAMTNPLAFADGSQTPEDQLAALQRGEKLKPQLAAAFLAWGWSEQRQIMRGLIISSDMSFAPFPLEMGFSGYPAPPGKLLAELQSRKVKDPPAALLALSKAQRAFVHKASGGSGSGGELVLYELSKAKCETRIIHRFDDYDRILAEMREG